MLKVAVVGVDADRRGKPCSVRHSSNRCVVILSVANPKPKDMPETFLDVLQEWDSTWLWESLWLIGDYHWII